MLHAPLFPHKHSELFHNLLHDEKNPEKIHIRSDLCWQFFPQLIHSLE
jgi:hypothetical protein